MEPEAGPGIAWKITRVMGTWSGTARRLLLAFGSLFVLFGAAAYFAMASLSEVHDLLHDVKKHEAAVRSSLELASAVRDQYAHQAHTIILGNETHLGFYDDARKQVVARLHVVREHARTTDERAWVQDIDRASKELDDLFREKIVPAVLRKDQETILHEHARAQDLVTLIQERADRLATSAERAIGDFESHAELVEHETVRWSLALFAGAMLLALALGGYIGRSVARPVAKLQAGAARLARGDWDTRIEIDTPDEFGRLAEQFNRMTTALKENQRSLVQSEKLAGIGRLAAGVAHEINNPLAVIIGYVRIMERSANGKLLEELRVIGDEATRCQQIVEGLLDLARPAKIESEPVALRELCLEALERLTEAEKLRTSDVAIDGAAVVHGNPKGLRQVLMNLLQNASEAAGPNGQVRAVIRAEPAGGVSVAVTDSGSGISEEARQRLFEPFFTTKPQGTGLGLAVSRAIAQAHGGDIEARLSAQGGATFVLRLPAKEGAHA